MDAQSRFASDASHELRTPLATMQVENEVALRNPKLTLGRAKELLQSNLEETMRLRAMSEHLLRLARDTNQPVKLVPVNVAEAVEVAAGAVQKLAHAKNITIDNKAAATPALADETCLVEAAQILLDNALKYSHDDTKVTITTATKNGFVQVRVSDQGVGIDAKDLPHIFERFYRADQSRSKLNVDGNGLGLSLAQKIVEQIGGRITVTSKAGKGSTFTIELPTSRLIRQTN
jgi:signal transduction histidine kinase